MSKGISAGVLIILGIILTIGGIMWDSSIGMAWQDLNNSTTEGTTQHAAVSAGQIFGYGMGMLIAALGVILIAGAVLMVVFSGVRGIGGR
jgi:hypothetical protein